MSSSRLTSASLIPSDFALRSKRRFVVLLILISSLPFSMMRIVRTCADVCQDLFLIIFQTPESAML
jgi:hypothetical protein